MSRGVARKAGEWSHVQVSAEVTFLPKRWFADEAQRSGEKLRHCAPSPSGRSTKALLESVTSGMPYVWEGESYLCFPTPSRNGVRTRTLLSSWNYPSLSVSTSNVLHLYP